MVKIEKLPIAAANLGEGPHWDEATQTLLFIDIPAGKAFKYDPATELCASVDLGFKPVSFIIPIEGKKDQYVVGNGNEVKKIIWDGKGPSLAGSESLFSYTPGEQETRLNDGKCDPRGRLWTGSMGPYLPESGFLGGKGAIYSCGLGKGLKQHVKGIGLSNGLAWSKDGKRFFYIDSLSFQVAAFDYNLEEGVLGERKVVFDLKANNLEGIPDGMTIDAEDKLWVANFEGARVFRVDPDSGKVLQTIEFPSYQITSMAFGGKNLDELYVTSACINNLSEDILRKYPDCGCTFRVTELGVKGLPMVNYKD